MGSSGIATRRKTMVCALEEFVRMGYIKKNHCKEIKRPKENERDEFLTPSELINFREVTLDIGALSSGLELTRDLFLFSCYTGLRFSDVCTLKFDNIKKGRLKLSMIKTGKKLDNLLNKRAKEILQKYEKRNMGERIFPYRSNVSVNRDLKFIARRAKIEKRISFHTGRHTFGSILNINKIQPSLIMELMGHGDLRMTSRYMNSNIEMRDEAMEAVSFD